MSFIDIIISKIGEKLFAKLISHVFLFVGTLFISLAILFFGYPFGLQNYLSKFDVVWVTVGFGMLGFLACVAVCHPIFKIRIPVLAVILSILGGVSGYWIFIIIQNSNRLR